MLVASTSVADHGAFVPGDTLQWLQALPTAGHAIDCAWVRLNCLTGPRSDVFNVAAMRSALASAHNSVAMSRATDSLVCFDPTQTHEQTNIHV